MPTTVLENSLRASSGVYVVVGAMHAAAEVVAIALARVLLNEAITLPATVGVRTFCSLVQLSARTRLSTKFRR